MNSPVSCLLDPIQNMYKRKNKNRKLKQGKVAPRPRRAPALYPSALVPGGPSGFDMPGTAYGAVMGGKKILPITSGMGRSMIVANYEQIVTASSLVGTGGYNIGGLVMNAGISAQWPWLGSIANNFQKFKFKFLRFIFVPQTPTTTPGSVFFYWANDPRDTAPANLAQVTASESAVVGNAWYGGPLNPDVAFSKQLTLKDNIYLDVDCTRFTQPWYYVRATVGATSNTVTLSGTATGGNGTLAIASGGTYDYTARPGTIYFGTDSITNTVVAGNMYVAYICEFSEPILASTNV
jgi:hypothetical protein